MFLSQFLILSAILFSIGVYGVLARRNAVLVLMSIELILNAVNINLVAMGAVHTQTDYRSVSAASVEVTDFVSDGDDLVPISNDLRVQILNAVEADNDAFLDDVTVWRQVETANISGEVFALFVIAVAAAEVGIGLAIVLVIYRNKKSIDLHEVDLLKG